MKFKAVKLIGGAKQTGIVMHRLAKEFALDMAPYANLTINDIFTKLANIPYRPDPAGHELVQRPKYTLRFGGDCDDKSIAAASYFINAHIPYRFKAVGFGNKKNKKGKIPLSHVYVEYKLGGEWIAFDATYSINQLGQQVNYTRSEYI